MGGAISEGVKDKEQKNAQSAVRAPAFYAYATLRLTLTQGIKVELTRRRAADF